MGMRKRIWIPLVMLAAAVLTFFGPLPGWVEGHMNKVDGQPLITVSPEAAALHRSLHIVDLHSDTVAAPGRAGPGRSAPAGRRKRNAAGVFFTD